MKASVVNIPDFPFGKKVLPEPRLEKVAEICRAQKTTNIQVEFTTEKDVKTADAIVCPKDKMLDLIVQDMEVLEGRSGRGLTDAERPIAEKAQALLEKETLLKDGAWSDEEAKWLMNSNCLTIRPVVVIDPAEVGDMPALTKKVFAAAGRILFLTGGPKEARAWELRRGANAVDAAGAIHSDIARGFIRAEVFSFEELAEIGNYNQARTTCLRQENKEYIVKDGDVIEFKFSV
jgi:hypothetical protein